MKRLKETHAKVDGEPTMLEQIYGGFNEFSRYGTTEEKEYNRQLEEMTRSDLESHARKIGVIMHESSARIKADLLREFKNYVTYLKKPTSSPAKKIKVANDVKKILAEGR